MNQVRVQRLFSKDVEGYSTLNVTSSSGDWGKEFSPFYLREKQHIYDDLFAVNFENLWQYCKVYEEHIDENGNPTEEYWKWAKEGWNTERAVRYPMGKGRVPKYSLFEGEKLGYIDARKRIYAPLYAREIYQKVEYRYLKHEFDNGRKIALKDFDGYDYIKRGMTLEEVLNCPTMKMGHAFVIAMMLEEKLIHVGDGKFEFNFK